MNNKIPYNRNKYLLFRRKKKPSGQPPSILQPTAHIFHSVYRQPKNHAITVEYSYFLRTLSGYFSEKAAVISVFIPIHINSPNKITAII